MNGYITLDGYKYKVRVQNYSQEQVVDRTFQKGVTGEPLGTYGETYRTWNYVIRVADTGLAGWGTKAILEATFTKTTPPDNRLTLIDHDGVTHTVLILSQRTNFKPLRPMADIGYYELQLEKVG